MKKTILIHIGNSGIWKLPCYIGIELVKKARQPHFCYCKEGIFCTISVNSSFLNKEAFKEPNIKKGSSYYKCFLAIPEPEYIWKDIERGGEMQETWVRTGNFVLSKKHTLNACSKECLFAVIKEHQECYNEIYSKHPHQKLMESVVEVLPKKQREKYEESEKNKAVIINLDKYLILNNSIIDILNLEGEKKW